MNRVRKVYLSPSVQDKNIGAGNYGTEEKRCNQIADVTQKVLERHGIKVYRNKVDMQLSTICRESNSYKVDVHLSIHTNAFNKKARGCEVYCHDINIGLKGEKLARTIYKRISAITPTADRGIKIGKDLYGPGKHLYELYNTVAAAALVEIAFHDNADDSKWILSNIQNIGIELAKGVLDYLGMDYIPEVISTPETGDLNQELSNLKKENEFLRKINNELNQSFSQLAEENKVLKEKLGINILAADYEKLKSEIDKFKDKMLRIEHIINE